MAPVEKYIRWIYLDNHLRPQDLCLVCRDSEDEMWSRFVFDLVKWPQEVTLARWTQPSGPLCLWQCFILFSQSPWKLIDFAPYISWWVNFWWEKLAPIGRTDTSKPCCTFNDRPVLWNNKDANKVVVVEMGLFLFCTYMVLWVHEICPKVLSTV